MKNDLCWHKVLFKYFLAISLGVLTIIVLDKRTAAHTRNIC